MKQYKSITTCMSHVVLQLVVNALVKGHQKAMPMPTTLYLITDQASEFQVTKQVSTSLCNLPYHFKTHKSHCQLKQHGIIEKQMTHLMALVAGSSGCSCSLFQCYLSSGPQIYTYPLLKPYKTTYKMPTKCTCPRL